MKANKQGAEYDFCKEINRITCWSVEMLNSYVNQGFFAGDDEEEKFELVIEFCKSYLKFAREASQTANKILDDVYHGDENTEVKNPRKLMRNAINNDMRSVEELVDLLDDGSLDY